MFRRQIGEMKERVPRCVEEQHGDTRQEHNVGETEAPY